MERSEVRSGSVSHSGLKGKTNAERDTLRDAVGNAK